MCKVNKTSIAHRIKNPLRRTSEHIALNNFKPLHNTYFADPGVYLDTLTDSVTIFK